ncbi:ATP-binding protein [Geomonas sp. RF6]|uniref:sensor histidine kinase n=1 Tax=Geomonas sp. RF6 TaxID=2897342 RepID=UPI001E34AF42|nr:ATP-binding protein [Geomonas sp. RF6]UFS69754.1 ATP-binding protein [Geomonas sp. RF6]
MPPSLSGSKATSIDLDIAARKYMEALEDFFNRREEKALYSVSNLGKELVMARHGPDILLEIHAASLKKLVQKLEPEAISRLVINANEVLFSGIMAYALNYYSYIDLLDMEHRKLEGVKLQLEEQARSLEEANRKLQEVDRDREQTLMQQSRLAAMGEMLVNISHQWRQPLNVLGMILQTLQISFESEAMTHESVEQGVTRARQLIAHMSETIDDFRNYLSPEKAMTDFDVTQVVEKAVSLVGETLQDVQLEMVRPAEPVVATGYRNEYVQTLINIFVNARDAFRERTVAEPRITVSIGKKGNRSVVTIADNAGGIPDDVIGRVFDPYFSTKPPDKGTGIGLFMCKTIIEKNMNGSLSVRNTAEGAEFRIEI